MHSRLEMVSFLNEIDAVDYIKPFIAVVESSETTGAITGAAVSSLHKFLLYGFMTMESPRVRDGIDLIVRGVSRYSFEETNPESDEVVLMKILELSALCLRCEVGILLSETRCWELFQTCHGISCAENASSLLSTTAGNTLAHIVLIVFSRAHSGVPFASTNLEAREGSIETNSADIMCNVEENEVVAGNLLESQTPEAHSTNAQPIFSTPPRSPSINRKQSFENVEKMVSPQQPTATSQTHRHRRSRKGKDHTPSHPDVLVLIMQFLSTLSNPRENSEAECILALSLINMALEAGGPRLSCHKRLVEVMQGDLSKHLLHSSQTEDLAILSLTLRVVFNLFNSIKDHLKVQLEVFLTSVHLRILEVGGHVPEQQELALESLLEFCREPALMLDLYTNYDCDMHCTNLFEAICRSLAMQALPVKDQIHLNTLNILGLEGVLIIIESMARRCISVLALSEPQRRLSSCGTQDNESDGYSSDTSSVVVDDLSGSITKRDSIMRTSLENNKEVIAQKLQRQKRMKQMLMLAVERFNSDQKGWITYTQELGLLPSPEAPPSATASFLKNSMCLDKTLLGEYLSKGPVEKFPYNAEVLEEYVRLFNFEETPFDEALRAFLLEFRLPGEAQCIDRLMEAFAKQYFEQGKGNHPFLNSDAAFVLSFSIIMLNTDLHNPNVRDDRRMTLEGFILNNRSINDNSDLPRPFLEGIYRSIAANEIIVHRDHTNAMQDGIEIDYGVHWDGILERSRQFPHSGFTNTMSRKVLHCAGAHERDMFTIYSDSAIEAMKMVFERTNDSVVVLRTMYGFHSYARICTYFGLEQQFSTLLVSLFQYGRQYAQQASQGVFPPPFPEMDLDLSPNSSLQMSSSHRSLFDVDSDVSEETMGVSIHRGLLALHTALELVMRHGNCVGDSWRYMVECLFTMLDVQALPSALSDVDDFSGPNGEPLSPSIFATNCVTQLAHDMGRKNTGGGLLGSLGTFLWGGTGESEKKGKEFDNSRMSISVLERVIDKAKLDQLFPMSKDLTLNAVTDLLKALLTCRDPAVAGVSEPLEAATSDLIGRGFEAHAVLALELGSRVILANRHRIAMLWPLMHLHMERLLTSMPALMRMPFLVERAMVTILRTCIHFLDVKELVPLLLPSLALLERLPAEVLKHLSSRLGIGLLSLVQANWAHFGTDEYWRCLMTLLSMASQPPGEGRTSTWEAIIFMVDQSLLTAQNAELIFRLVVRYLEGNFTMEEKINTLKQQNYAWARQALEVLEKLVFTLMQSAIATEGKMVANSSPPPRTSFSFSCSTVINGESVVPPSASSNATLPATEGPQTLSAALNGDDDLHSGGGSRDSNSKRDDSISSTTQDSSGNDLVIGLSVQDVEGLWYRTLRIAAPFVVHPWPDVAKTAAGVLQNLLMLETSSIIGLPVWQSVFLNVLLQLPLGLVPAPKATEKTQKQPPQAAHFHFPDDFPDEPTRLQCVRIVSGAFLHHLAMLSSLPIFNKVWLTFIALVCSNMKEPGTVMHESMQQIVTNMIMVMVHTGVFCEWSVGAGKERDLLKDTFSFLDPVAPSVRHILVPAAEEEVPTTEPEPLKAERQMITERSASSGMSDDANRDDDVILRETKNLSLEPEPKPESEPERNG